MVDFYISHKSKKKVVISEMVNTYLVNAYNFYKKELKQKELLESLKAEIDKRELTI